MGDKFELERERFTTKNIYTTFLEDSSVYAEYMKTFSSMQGNANYKPYIKVNYIHKGAFYFMEWKVKDMIVRIL